MSLDLLKRDIELRTFRRLYYFYGEEPYLKRFYVNSLISAVLPENRDMDLHRYEGKGLDPDCFAEELWLCPGGEYKIMLITDLPISGPVAELLSGEDFDIPEDTVVIIYQQTEVPDLRTKAFKMLMRRLNKDGLAVAVNTVDDATLSRWVVQQFRRRGCSIEPKDVAYFLSVEEHNMESMLTEIDKLAVYCGDTVTREALEKLCVKSVQARAYELNDLILEKNSDKVFSVLNNLRALRTPPQMILGSLFSCFANLYKLKVMEDLSESARGEETGLKPFLVRKYAGYLSRIPQQNFDKLLDVCSEIDVLAKTSRIDQEILIVRLVTEAMDVL